MAFLDVTDLTLHYATGDKPVRAVDKASFSIKAPGEAIGIIGETGSGKSSLVMSLTRVLPGNVERYDGSVLLNGVNLMTMENDDFRREIRWKKIAVVFQGAMNGFNPVVRIGKQLIERMVIDGIGKEEAVGKTVAALSSVGLPAETMERFAHELSGGMKQRAAIAMALTMDPELLILDEPTSALDVSVQAQIMNVLKKLKWERKISMIFITHDIALASDLCDYVAVMYAGKIREIGPIDLILGDPKDPYTQELMANVPRLRGGEIAGRSGEAEEGDAAETGCRFRLRCPKAYAKCVEEPPFTQTDPDRSVRCWLHAEEDNR